MTLRSHPYYNFKNQSLDHARNPVKGRKQKFVHRPGLRKSRFLTGCWRCHNENNCFGYKKHFGHLTNVSQADGVADLVNMGLVKELQTFRRHCCLKPVEKFDTLVFGSFADR